MEEIKLEFEFSDEDFEMLHEEETTIREFIDQVLDCVDPYQFEDPLELIGFQLLSDFSDEGGAPEISENEIVDLEYDEKTMSGSVTFDYLVSYSYTCSDMNKEYERYTKVPFYIDVDAKVVVFIFLKTEPRTTRDEF